MEDYFINMAISTLLIAIKSKAKKRQLKRAMLKVYRAIQAVYADDKDFA